MKSQKCHGVTFYFRNFDHSFSPNVLRDIVQDLFPWIHGYGGNVGRIPRPKETMEALIAKTGIRQIVLIATPRKPVFPEWFTDMTRMADSPNIYAMQSCSTTEPKEANKAVTA